MRLAACALVLLAVTAAARADRPKLAVLGIVPKAPYPAARATALTAAIRASAKGYRVTGTPKQVERATLAAECDPQRPACAAKLGAQLGAVYVIAGEVERRGRRDIVTLALVDVRTKQRIRSLRDTTASTAGVKKWARTAVARLVDTEAGELVLAANAQDGEIYIDGVLVGALYRGRATIGGLANGGHQLAIKAPGYKPFEVEIEVAFSTKQTVLLEPARPPQ